MADKKKTKTEKKLTPEQKRAEVKRKILEKFIKFVHKKRRNPTEAELMKSGVSRNAVRYHFGNPTGLKEAARHEDPEAFKGIIDETLFNRKNLAELKRATTKYKRFVVTTAVAGGTVHQGFYKSLQSYCKKNDALLLVIPVKAPATTLSNKSNNSWELDPFLGEAADNKELMICFGDVGLNANLFVSGIKVSAKQIDPTTGVSRLSRGCSFILGSPKQRLKFKPNAKHKHAHFMHGTGAATLPNYESKTYMGARTGYLAEFDHVLGALVVELNRGELFHLRQLQADLKTGGFVDLSYHYTADGKVSRMYPEAFVLGDWHAGSTDPTAKKAWKEVVEHTKPQQLILHDLFNGKSVNHHESKNLVSRAISARQGKTNLEEEIKVTAKDLNEITSWTKDGVVVTYSNHDDFLFRYLDKGQWKEDRENLLIATDLIANAMAYEKMPLPYGVEKHMTEEAKEKTKWLKMDESFLIAGIECGMHGHAGPNGARGNLRNFEETYGAVVMGHSHTAGILRDAWQVGTSSYLDEGFNKGGSSWSHTSCLVYPNGARQLITSIKGKWKKS